MDEIREIVRGIIGEMMLNESGKLSVFDFDSTLVNTPLPDEGEKETGKKWGHEWWESPESLDQDVYDMKPNDDVIKDHKKELENEDTTVVMITGRKGKIKKHVNKIIDDLKLDFDDRLFNGGKETTQDKMDKMEKILKDNPDIKEVEIWEDRHIDIYTKWGNKKVKDGELDNFNINHIKESNEVSSVISEVIEDSFIAYHGSPKEISKFVDDFVGGENAHDQQGAGIYFATNPDDAAHYGENIYKVNIDGNFLDRNAPVDNVDPEEIVQLIKMKDEWEMHAQDYSPDPEVGAYEAAHMAMQYNHDEAEVWQQIEADFYRYDSIAYVRNMTKLGYDGIIVDAPSGISGDKHIIVFNPNAITFIEKIK